MKKRILSIVLALSLMLSIAAVTSITASAESLTSGDYIYKELYDGTVEITGYNGNPKTLDIPSAIGGKNVTKIGMSAFENCETLVSVTIPDSVTEIDGYAFENCTSLTSISIGKNVEYILPYAFNNTAYYNDINNWEDGILYIDNYVISGYLLKWCDDEQNPYKVFTEAQGDVTIKSGTKLIADLALGGCKKITSVTMPNSVSSIGEYAFCECTSLKNVSFGSGIKRIDGLAFSECTSLSKITIPGSVTEIASYAFVDCPLIKEVTLPASVKIIGQYAFGYISVPNEETVIADYVPIEDFHINCYEYTDAEYYAIENGFDYTLLSAEYGDVNYDGNIDMLDVLLMRKYIAKQPIDLDTNLADVNCDDNVDMLDVLLMRKYIAKQPVTLGPKG